MSIPLRLAIPTAAPCPVLTPRARAAQPAGNAGFPPTARTGALRGCAAMPLRPQPLVRPCRTRGSAVVCTASAYLSLLTTQWVSVAAAAVLLLAKGTSIHKSFLVPLFVLQAPSTVISWIKSEYGLWTAFLALAVRLFLPFPGELELPLSTMLVVSVAPYQVMNVRSEYGLWTAFLALAVRLFLPFPGELELPLSTMLVVSVAPYQVMNVRWEVAKKKGN